tara:strand:- start:131 stop:442 length:312 start_codon:yes stop_codon:yes gene_type:complete
MSFKLSDKQMQMLIDMQTAPPSTGDLYMWGFVDRKEKRAAKKMDKAASLRERANELESRGRWRRAERLRRRAARKEGKAEKKMDQARRKKMRPDYWMRRGETL